MFKYSGVVLDLYDDDGETLKKHFPTADKLPDLIKNANVRPKEKLAAEDFALVALDSGAVLHKYACNDPGTTAISVMYFMEHGHKLPEEAQKTAALNLLDSCKKYHLEVPQGLQKTAGVFSGLGSQLSQKATKAIKSLVKAPAVTKMAAIDPDTLRIIVAGPLAGALGGLTSEMIMDPEAHLPQALAAAIMGGAMGFIPGGGTKSPAMGAISGAGANALARAIANTLIANKEKTSSVVDITGKSPKPLFKVAKPMDDNDYAVILSDGSRHYPINTLELVKQAEQYYLDDALRMDPEIRRQYAVKLAAKSQKLGYDLDDLIKEAGATSFAPRGHRGAAIAMRKVSCAPGEDRKFLDELLEKSAEIRPEVYAEVLRRFDVDHGLDRGWGHVILDPWASTYSLQKEAEVVWEDGADRITSDELANLAMNHFETLYQTYNFDFVKEFQKDPVALFNSLPSPQKRFLARLAFDMAHSGDSETHVHE